MTILCFPLIFIVLQYMFNVYIVVLYVYILFILHRGLKKGKGERKRVGGDAEYVER